MINSFKQVVKREISSREKKIEFFMVGVCFFAFLFTYIISSFLGFFSIIGYLAAIAIVVYLCYFLKRYSYYYIYQISDDDFSVFGGHTKRNVIPLFSFPLSALISVSETPPNDEITNKITACISSNHSDNLFCVISHKNKKTLLSLTPNKYLKKSLVSFAEREVSDINEGRN